MELDHRTKELLELAKLHHRATGLELATIATKVMNDGKFFDRIESGGGFTTRTYDKVKNWFLIHTPKHKSSKQPLQLPASP